MLTNEDIRKALSDPSLTGDELNDVRLACNAVAEIFLEFRASKIQKNFDQNDDEIPQPLRSD